MAFTEIEVRNQDGQLTPCELAGNYLRENIACPENKRYFSENYVEQHSDSTLDDEFSTMSNEEIYESVGYFQQIHEIYTGCKENCKHEVEDDSDEGDLENERDNSAYYKPNLAKKLLELCRSLPIWSAIMNKPFSYGNSTESSASSEYMFNDLKNRIFKHETLPMTVDLFLPQHIISINGSTKIIHAKETQTVQFSNKEKIHDDKIIKKLKDADEVHNVQNNVSEALSTNEASENWRGQATQPKKKRRNYLDPDPAILKYGDTKTKNKVVGILKNATSLTLKAIKISKNHYTLTNTCSFDAIIQILFISYVDSGIYATFVDDNSSLLIFELIRNGIRDGITVQTYRKRAMILKNLFEPELTNAPNHFVVNAATTAFYMISQLFHEFPSIKEIKNCDKCEKTSTMARPLVTIHLQTTNDIINLEQYVSGEIFYDKKCGICGSSTTTQFEIGSHIFLELFNVLKPQSDLSIRLCDIPQSISLLDKEFKLRGVIEFIPPLSKDKNSIGHYVAHARREYVDQWEKFNDMIDHVKGKRPQTVLKNCQIIIYSV